DGVGEGVEEGLVSLEPNDDFAMGAPPSAPGAIETARTIRPTDANMNMRHVRGGTDITPRAVTVNLPFTDASARNPDSDEQDDTPVRPKERSNSDASSARHLQLHATNVQRPGEHRVDSERELGTVRERRIRRDGHWSDRLNVRK
ncbi:hypothetical protein FA95DRAFT_1612885, partial [Auriscalpium vulgare]